MRANAHRPVLAAGRAVGVEVAASPDPPGRPEPWSWHIRLLTAKAQPRTVDERAVGVADRGAEPIPGSARTLVELSSSDAFRVLEVQVDPEQLTADVQLVAPRAEQLLERAEEELMAVVAASGEAMLEDRHRLLAGDALVLSGDDPLAVRACNPGGALAVVRLRATQRRTVGWVP